MDNETKISLSFKNSISGDAKLEKYAQQLERIYGAISALDKGQSKTLSIVQESAKKTTKGINETEKATRKMSKQFETAFNVVGIRTFTNAMTRLFTSLTKMATKSSSYVENVNLLEVAYHNAGETIEQSSKRIETFIEKMAEVYGFDESRLTRQLGIFKQLANAMQLPSEQGEKLSEIMVKMTNDVASLYNLDLERASNALQSALVGQTRPIRGATGADITEKTLQTTADALGLDRQISELSFVEKRLVMVISLTNQLKVSQGDYARTIESASNQIRVMKEQWDRLSRAVGNVFYPILQGILPYLNGILMALTEIFNMIASLLGFEMPEFDYSNLSAMSDSALDLADSLDTAGESAKKLKNGLRGFDKLNVIGTQKGDSSAVGTIDPKIMNAFNKAYEDYDDMMDSVRMKARDIRDSILQWLGFERGINEETGKIEWKYQGFGKTLENIWDTYSNLDPLVQTFVNLLLLSTSTKIISGLGKLGSSLGKTGIAGALKTISDFSKISVGGQKLGILGGIDFWKQTATGIERVKMGLTGSGGLVVGYGLTVDAMKRINDEGLTTLNTLELVGGGVANIAGGAMIGASIGGGAGAVIGAIGGAIISLGQAIFNYESSLDKLVKKSKNSLDEVKDKSISIQKEIADTEMEISSNMSETNYHEKLLDELNSILDANGKIKSGYEDRAKYILDELSKTYGVEYKLVDNTLQKQGDFNDKVKEAIRLKEQEIILEAYKDDYINALKKQNELYSDIEKSEKDRNKTLKVLDEILSDSGITYEDYLSALDKYNKGVKLSAKEEQTLTKVAKERYGRFNVIFKGYEELYKNYDDSVKVSWDNYYQNNTLINRYSDYSMAVQTGNLEKINEARDEYTKTWVKDGQVITNSEETEAGKRIATYWANIKSWKDANDERYTTYVNTLTDIKNYTEGVTPEIADKWSALGKLSTEDFMKNFAKLPNNIKQDVVDKMYEQGTEISKELQDGINEKFPQVEISPKILDPTRKQLEDYAKKIGKSLSEISGYIPELNIVVGKSILGSLDSKKAGGGIFANGKWHDVAKYATGTTSAPVGQMFLARESGPELVGTIGNHTAVMNNDQIVSSVASGVYQAVKSANSSTSKQPQIINIYLDKDRKLATYVIDDLDDIAKSNGKPIEIGG